MLSFKFISIATLATLVPAALAATCTGDTNRGTAAQYYSVAGNICNNGYWSYTQNNIQGLKSGASSDSYCWDAYNDIIEQCIEDNTGASGGYWSLDGQTYSISGTISGGE